VTEGRRTPGAESGRRLLTCLTAFTADRPSPTVAELAAVVGVPASTAYRYVSLLREVGLVEAAGEGTYRLTDRVQALAAAAEAGQDDLASVATPVLKDLRDAIDETVLVVRRGGEFAYCVAREESTHPVRLQFAVGQAMPLHSGSAARVLLAAMQPRARGQYVQSLRDEGPAARRGLLDASALDEVHAAGWTESYEEVDEGIWGVAAAITRGSGGAVVGALGTAGPLFRLDEARRSVVIEAVRDAAARISEALGASGTGGSGPQAGGGD
jgi:DNA-binding IclR family transcriptional regulator